MTDDKHGKNDEQVDKNAGDQGEVIRFPIERLKNKRKLKKLAKGDGKKVTLFLSMISVLVLATYLNQMTSNSVGEVVKMDENGRMIANYAGYERDADEEARLADELSDPKKRGLASYGRRPSMQDELQMQDLNRRYRPVFADGLVMEIHQLDQGGILSAPVYIRDRKAFLEKYRDVIAPGYDEVQFEIPEGGGNLTEENYLLLRSGTPVGRAVMKLDRAGAFISMMVQVFPENQQ